MAQLYICHTGLSARTKNKLLLQNLGILTEGETMESGSSLNQPSQPKQTPKMQVFKFKPLWVLSQVLGPSNWDIQT